MPVYSGYMSIFPLVSALSTTSVAPMLAFRLTLKPLARRACAYSSPRVSSSGKFLSPRVTAGLPAPGWPLGALVELLFLLLPHPPVATTTRATRATASARRWIILLLHSWDIDFPQFPGRLRSARRSPQRRPESRRLDLAAQPARRDQPLDDRQQELGRECQRRHDKRGPEHARKPVARLVEDDVAEPAAAGYRRESRRGDHVHRGGADASEYERERQRQLDPHQDLEWVHPHAPRGVDDVGVDPVDGGVRVREYHREGEHD